MLHHHGQGLLLDLVVGDHVNDLVILVLGLHWLLDGCGADGLLLPLLPLLVRVLELLGHEAPRHFGVASCIVCCRCVGVLYVSVRGIRDEEKKVKKRKNIQILFFLEHGWWRQGLFRIKNTERCKNMFCLRERGYRFKSCEVTVKEKDGVLNLKTRIKGKTIYGEETAFTFTSRCDR